MKRSWSNVLFGIDEELLKSKSSYNTAKEILQQPKLWKETLENFKKTKNNLEEYLKKIGLNEEFQVIFTGAGTSEYIGNILELFLKKNSNLEFKSIGTTEILNNPSNYLKKNRKILLVSFARSGDSPESVGVVNLMNENIKDIYHLFITCNKEGALAKILEENKKAFLLLMPEKSNDKSFAMTSSFSCMLLSGILAFSSNIEKKYEEIEKIIELASKELNRKYEKIKKLAEEDHKRIVILGSGILSGLGQELALKIMELSAGKVVAVNNTTLGFRHGPKSIINEKTIIFNLINESKYAKKYDEDLLEEMKLDEKANKIVVYCINKNEKIEKNADELIFIEKNDNNILDNQLASLFIYLVYGQMYAFFKSQYLGNTTDNPFPTGEVNRVVKKFKIYKFEWE
ncbi:MAG: SIS domain-containing protein [Leptotrichiaceae bacterium]|nr:SIS domain-containing protein [Leptotrichiaceae bacterium]MBP6280484.1 SIS domain-containing protein [Leptotrichiaceae bacterium]MBP7099923.1 SIS domain-containing protein [Leptotrichiaceae bacterium]MBP7725332.1 SIS domain-containing protein [Leptotrichiaceae bacterium]MBP9629108.1 SIS domain-containing protein [Leptotrichiaceae bacterium]